MPMVTTLILSVALAKVPPPETQTARFVVITQPRSGSTWFVKYSAGFAKCAGVVTSGEIMHPRTLRELSPTILGKRVETCKHAEYLRYMRGVYDTLARGKGWWGEAETSEPQGTVRAVGFKLMYAQLPQMGPGAPVSDQGMMRNVTLKGLLKWAAEANVVVIHLLRLNHLERHISLQSIRTANLSYHVKGAPTLYSFGKAVSMVQLDVNEAFQFARSQLKQNRNLQHFLDSYCLKFGVSCRTVAFEHLIGDDTYFAELRKALGIVHCKSASLSSETPSWVPCSDRVRNWHEFEASTQFSHSVWLDMCRNGDRIPAWLEAMAPPQGDDARLLRLDPSAFERGRRFPRITPPTTEEPPHIKKQQRRMVPPPGLLAPPPPPNSRPVPAAKKHHHRQGPR